MTVEIRYRCDRCCCRVATIVAVLGDELHGRKPLAKFAPEGWVIRKPRDGHALAFCPEHGRRESADTMTHTLDCERTPL